MSDVKLAKVGDVIEHGQDIPANVVRMRDSDGEKWSRGEWAPATSADWFPMTVVEVDPEPQPAEPTPLHRYEPAPGMVCAVCGGNVMDDIHPDVQREQRCPDREPHEAHEHSGFARPEGIPSAWCPGRQPAEDPRDDLIRKVMAELGVEHPGDVLEALEKRFNALVMARTSREENRRERLRAEAEVKRLSARLDEATEALTELKPAESGPLVLTLPEVPKEAVALIGAASGRRWVPYSGPLADQSPRQWEERNGESFTGRIRDDAGVLFEEGSVTVEFAPPREPRTWPKLDPAPDDLPAVQGASGTIYRRWAPNSAYYFPPPKEQRAVFRDAKLLSHWREVDGPLTEVLS